jgi:hypothetical protein
MILILGTYTIFPLFLPAVATSKNNNTLICMGFLVQVKSKNKQANRK